MRALFDVNLLAALFDEDHVHHRRAHEWWSAHREHGWASCPLTQNGYIRVVSQPAYPNSLSVASAREFLAGQISATDHRFWPDDLSLLDETRFEPTRVLGPRQLTDVYLLGLAVKRDGRLVTFDDGIPRDAVLGAEERHLVVI